jgi:uncharacterized membrane protein
MHIQLGPDAPLLARAAAATVLALHIGAGCVAIGSGAVALAARKGGRAHRMAGNAFFAAMLATFVVGAPTAPFIGQQSNLFGGVFGTYLVISGWATARGREGQVGWLAVGAMLIPAVAAPALLAVGWMGAQNRDGALWGIPYQVAFVVAAAAAFTGALDLSVLMRGGLSGAQRVARHLWRMCLTLFFAAAALIINQPQDVPLPLRGSPLLVALVYAPLGLMVFWLLRVQFTDAFRPAAAPAA